MRMECMGHCRDYGKDLGFGMKRLGTQRRRQQSAVTHGLVHDVCAVQRGGILLRIRGVT